MNKIAFEHELKKHKHPLVVDFWAPWCTPCKITRPILKKLAEEFKGKVGFLEVDADQSPEVMRGLGVMAIPTLLVYQDGKQVLRQTGAKSADAYRKMFQELSEGKRPSPAAQRPIDRVLRIGAGAALAFLGWQTHLWVLIALGAGLAFTGVYDRCPIWRAVTGWIRDRMEAKA